MLLALRGSHSNFQTTCRIWVSQSSRIHSSTDRSRTFPAFLGLDEAFSHRTQMIGGCSSIKSNYRNRILLVPIIALASASRI